MKTTKEIFEEMEEDYSNILGCSSSILAIAKEQLKEKDKEIKFTASTGDDKRP